MGWNLQVGKIEEQYLTEQQIWKTFNVFFSSQSKNTTTYKFGLIKSLIENLYNVNENLELNYDFLFESFAKIYWNLVIHHNLRQVNHSLKSSEIEKVLINFCEKFRIPSDFRFDRLSVTLQLELVQKVKTRAKRYVIGALYGDSEGVIYEFDLKREYMRLNSSIYSFMLKYQKVLTYLTNYHLALFLEKHNKGEDTAHMLMKVENVSKRSSLDQFYRILISFGENTCFYCGKLLDKRSAAHVDHFIPWSFVQTDHLWNLVLACRTCNISKKDRIAKPIFLNALIERNQKLIEMEREPIRRDLEIYNSEKLEKLYHYSIMNGFRNLWSP
ncbi:HNH endonuclease signature motif containing protein [Anoxybacillus flavithermus]|uniref:HNH endonuclease n=1 Tax=Anoxybacillus flavithermus AK1 TaxID=1297581 RepID=M8CY65_9BACL|nr:HNH endonuclease signature motif containing protein [Anoxybacillus flavithermus]EMT46443.1 HNH endonuclease [Anoxybacillus flavithermus AK1]